MQVAGTAAESHFPAPMTRRGHVTPHAVQAEVVEVEAEVAVPILTSLKDETYTTTSAPAFVEDAFILQHVFQSREMFIDDVAHLQIRSD